MPPPSRARQAAVWTAERLAAGLGQLCGQRWKEGFGILCYHRVAEVVPGVEPPTWNVTPGQLRAQLSGLLACGFEPWPLAKLIRHRHLGRAIPANAFVVTFDDGYENNYTAALPVLKELRVPATIFLATAYLDSHEPFPFDDWSATGTSRVPARSWHPLSTAQCHELLASGIIELAAHTHRHERFVGRCDDFARDLDECLETLATRFGIRQPAFAFPYGASSPELNAAARQAGVRCILSTKLERVQPEQDEFQWGRFTVVASDNAAVLAAKLSGWYTTVATAGKRVMRRLSAAKSAAAADAPAGNTHAVQHDPLAASRAH
ncbi:MAG: polysaccharide deacetylase family protein [Pirellulales bacterium]